MERIAEIMREVREECADANVELIEALCVDVAACHRDGAVRAAARYARFEMSALTREARWTR